MARFWVGGTGNWSDNTNHWASVSGGTPGATLPDATQDVTFDGNSGVGTVTCDVTPSCASIDFTGAGVSNYGGTFDVNGKTLTVGSNLLSASKVAFAAPASMTFLRTGGGTIFVVLGSGAGTITTAGQQMPSWNIGGNGGTWTFQDDFVQAGASNVFTFAPSGTLNMNGKNVTFGSFTSTGASIRTLTMGNAQITILAGGTAWDLTNATNITITPSTATITFSGASAGVGGAVTYSGASFVFTGSGQAQFGGGTVANLTRIGTAVKTDSLNISNTTITGTLTLTGNSVTNRLFVTTFGIGSQRILTLSNAPSLTNVDFMDISVAGAASPVSGTSLGDALGNAGINFDASTPQAWQGTSGGSWDDPTKWTSRVPLPQDDVSFPVAFSASQTISVNMPRIGRTIDFSGATGSPTLSYGTGLAATSPQFAIFGSVNLTGLGSIVAANSAAPWFRARSSVTIRSGGVSFPGGSGNDVQFQGPNATFTLLDNLSWGCAPSLSIGSFVANGFNVRTFGFAFNPGSANNVLNMGSGTWTLTGSAQIWNFNNVGTLIAGTSTILIIDTTSAVKTFVGGGKTYNILRYASVGTGGLTITGSNTFATLDVEAFNARTLTLPANGRQVVSGGVLTLRGKPGATLSIVSSSPGTPTTLVVADGTLYNLDSDTPSADVTITLPPSSGGGTGQGIAWKGHV